MIWYLAFARHASKHLRQRSTSHLEALDDAHDRSDLSSDDSEEDDYIHWYNC